MAKSSSELLTDVNGFDQSPSSVPLAQTPVNQFSTMGVGSPICISMIYKNKDQILLCFKVFFLYCLTTYILGLPLRVPPFTELKLRFVNLDEFPQSSCSELAAIVNKNYNETSSNEHYQSAITVLWRSRKRTRW